jgi:hypothetical protein
MAILYIFTLSKIDLSLKTKSQNWKSFNKRKDFQFRVSELFFSLSHELGIEIIQVIK